MECSFSTCDYVRAMGYALFDAREARLRAFGRDGDVADDGVVTDVVWMRVGRAALGHRGKLVFRVVQVGVVSDEYVGSGFGYDISKAGGRLYISVEPEFIRTARRDVGGAPAQPVKSGSSPGSGEVR